MERKGPLPLALAPGVAWAAMGRTFAIGDLHGDIDALERLLGDLPAPGPGDSLVFLGDYVDRGPKVRETVEFVRALPGRTRARVVTLRGNHEDSWLRIVHGEFGEFVFPRPNGCLESLRSFRGEPAPAKEDAPREEEWQLMLSGRFLPRDVVAWMEGLPYYHEDEHAIYVHGGLPREGDRFLHPSEVDPPRTLLWVRTRDFFINYRGKYVVFGHTRCANLPQELSAYTPDDPSDVFAGPCVAGIDTGAGKGGFLTALELPARRVYESRRTDPAKVPPSDGR
jgi:serine/threonine protein phosphatase 1